MLIDEAVRVTKLMQATELAYSEIAFAVQDISDPRRRKDDLAWSEMRGKRLAKVADALRAAIEEVNGNYIDDSL